MKDRIDNIQSANLKTFLLCIFSSIIVLVSNQESNTRYAAIDKKYQTGDVIRTFTRKLKSELKNIKELSEKKCLFSNVPIIINKNTADITVDDIPNNSIDIIITSPPYANSYDYYLYHKWRMIWLGYDYKAVQNAEIGSRHEHSSKHMPLSVFEDKMEAAMKQLSRVLKPNKLAFFFVGDSIISGELINMSECFDRIAQKSGFSVVSETEYSLCKVSKSFLEKKSTKRYQESKIASKKMQRILVFEPFKKTYYSFEAERIISTSHSAHRQVRLDQDCISDNEYISIVRSDDAESIHGLGKYPAKFIPDIPKWAITNYSKQGDTILDPFNGSGTTTVEATLLERNAVGIDISSFACLLANAKKPLSDVKQFKSDTQSLITALNKYKSNATKERMVFENDLFWFSEKNLIEIEYIRKAINSLSSQESKDFYLAVLGTIIKPCSFLDEGQIKVKRSQKKLLNGVPSPISLMQRQIEKNSTIKLQAYGKINSSESCEILNQSVLSGMKEINDNSIDLIVTSPPYINAMNYPMNHRYESFLLNLLSPENSIEYQQQFIGTERVFAKDYKILRQFPSDCFLGQQLNQALKDIYKLEPKRSFIVYKYFYEMHMTFKLLYKKLKKGAGFVLVAGTNTIKGVPIDTFFILKGDLETIGMKAELSFHYDIINNALKITRHKTADIIKYDGVAVLRKE